MPNVELGMYESLLTDNLHRQLQLDSELHAVYGTVDVAEQASAIARHLAPIIERSLRAASGTEERTAIARRILNLLPANFAAGEDLRQLEAGKLSRLDELISANALAQTTMLRPATPFSDAALDRKSTRLNSSQTCALPI